MRRRQTLLATLLILATAPAAAQAPAATPALAPATVQTPATDNALPAMNFGSTIASDALYTALRATPQFAHLDKELYGSPLSVFITHSYTNVMTASEVATGILAIGTLGLMPVHTTRALTVRYDFMVNGTVVATRTYAKNISRTYNVHSKDQTFGLGNEGLDWVRGTAAQFASDASADPKIAALVAEYHLYYDEPAAQSP